MVKEAVSRSPKGVRQAQQYGELTLGLIVWGIIKEVLGLDVTDMQMTDIGGGLGCRMLFDGLFPDLANRLRS